MDLCISCKACASECSSVDMASYKAEFLYQYQKEHRSLRDRIFAYNGKLSKVLNPVRGSKHGFQPHFGKLNQKIIRHSLWTFLPKLCSFIQTIDRQKSAKI